MATHVPNLKNLLRWIDFQIWSIFQSLLKKSLLLGCTVIWLKIICMRNYNLHTENFTVLKQHWHVYMMTYWGPLMTKKVYYLLCSIWVLLLIPLTMMYFWKDLSLDSVSVEQVILVWQITVCPDQWHSIKTNFNSMWCTSRICTWSNSIHYLHAAFGWHNQEAWNAVSHVCRWLSIIHHFRGIWHQSDSFKYGNFDWWHPWLVLGKYAKTQWL